MTAPLARVRQLLAKAVDRAAPLEEARTCALTAARLIHRHNLPVGGAPAREPEGDGPGFEVVVEVRPRAAAGSGRYFVEYEASRAGRCQECGKGFARGQRIGWRNPIGPVHLGC